MKMKKKSKKNALDFQGRFLMVGSGVYGVCATAA